jgi:formate dehydrogenase major subunit
VELSDVRDKYDAVIVAIGAWKSVKLNIPDEIGGTDFLRGVAEGNPDVVGLASRGSRVSVIGGGNTAMDVCRVALRSGAEKVYCVYRRTREEMPAEPHEVEAAEKEGVEFLFSTPPDRIPDDVNVVISAIGNKPRLDGFDELEVTDWGTIVTHPDTFLTSTKTASGSPVFAIGDATNKGTDIAARAIGEGRKCAGAVDDFLSGKPVKDSKSVMSVKSEKTAEDFAHIARQARVEITDKQSAREEAKRCLECGCNAYAERSCKLYRYANLYGARADAYSGERHDGKCIMCGLCVRAFDDVLGFVNRGFDVRVQAENLSADFEKCPTGAYYDMMRGN